MLTKLPAVTVIPAVPGQEFHAATHECATFPPPSSGGDGLPPLPPAGIDDGVVPTPGASIILEAKNGSGGYTTSTAYAPPPVGYVCRYEMIWVVVPGSTDPAEQITIVCTEQ